MTRDSLPGTLVISLDFELMWGVRDQPFAEAYRRNLIGARAAIPRMLDLFAEFGIHATWATVGFLFFENREELLAALPRAHPSYENAQLSPYGTFDELDESEHDDSVHYGASLVQLIANTPHQEIATHTFSHYYCLEPEQDLDAFRDDLRKAIEAARRFGYRIYSVVFPRNQLDANHLEVCKELGIVAYRGVESSWVYASRKSDDESMFRRGVRLLDSYVNLSGHHAYPRDVVASSTPANVPSSRFLRPYSPALRLLEPLKRRRILNDLTHAASNGLIYHLWWHPHNFGGHLEESLMTLRAILTHFATLRSEMGMTSSTMRALASGYAEDSEPRAAIAT